MSQAMNFESAAKIAELYLLSPRGGPADGVARPSWTRDDFFAARFVR